MATSLSEEEQLALIAAGDLFESDEAVAVGSGTTIATVLNSYTINEPGEPDTIYSHLYQLTKWPALLDPHSRRNAYSGSLKMIMAAQSKEMSQSFVITGKDASGREALMGFVNKGDFISQCDHHSDRTVQAYPVMDFNDIGGATMLQQASDLISKSILLVTRAITGGVFFTVRSPSTVRYSSSNPGSITMKIVGMMSLADSASLTGRIMSWAEYDAETLSIPAVVGRVYTSVHDNRVHDNLYPTLSELTLSMAHRLATDKEYYAKRRDGISRQGMNEPKYKIALGECKRMYEALMDQWRGSRKYVDSILVDMQKAVEDNGVPQFNETGGFYKYEGKRATLELTGSDLRRKFTLNVSVTGSSSNYNWFGVVYTPDLASTIQSLATEFDIGTGESEEFDLSGVLGESEHLGRYRDSLLTAVLLQLVRYILRHDATACLAMANNPSMIRVSMLESIALDGPIRFRTDHESFLEDDVAKAITNLLQGLKPGSNYEPRITGSHGAGAPVKFRYKVFGHQLEPLSLYDGLMSIYCHLRIHSSLPSWIADLEVKSTASEIVGQIRKRITLMNGSSATPLARNTLAMMCDRRKIATTLTSLE